MEVKSCFSFLRVECVEGCCYACSLSAPGALHCWYTCCRDIHMHLLKINRFGGLFLGGNAPVPQTAQLVTVHMGMGASVVSVLAAASSSELGDTPQTSACLL